eukprot:scaffold193129_cov23-Tisochrysis_lutea.AAC.1
MRRGNLNVKFPFFHGPPAHFVLVYKQRSPSTLTVGGAAATCHLEGATYSVLRTPGGGRSKPVRLGIRPESFCA